MTDSYFEVNLTGTLTYFNQTLSKLFGYPPDELLGMNNREFTDEANAKILFNAFNQVYKTDQPVQQVEWQVDRKDGSRVHISTSAALLKNSDGEPAGFYGISRDITPHKKSRRNPARKRRAV